MSMCQNIVPGREAPRCGINDLSHGPCRVAAAVMILALIVAAAIIWWLEAHQIMHAKSRATTLAVYHAQSVERRFDHAFSATYALAALVRQGRGSIADFESVAKQMLHYYPGVAALGLAPNGVLEEIVPLAGNERALGQGMIAGPARVAESRRAIDAGTLTLAGPHNLVQGGVGAIARLPVYLGPVGATKFWGFTTVLIRIPDFFGTGNFEDISNLGYRYRLWRINPATGVEQTILENGSFPPDAGVNHPITVPNGVWMLSLAPQKGWIDLLGLTLKSAFGLLFSLVLAWLAKVFVELKSHREQLELLVEKKTAELRASRDEFQSLVEAMPQIVWIATKEDREFRFNRKWGDYTGQTGQNISFASCLESIHADDRAAVRKAWRLALTTVESVTVECRLLRADGAYRWWLIRGVPQHDEQGRTIAWFGTCTDIDDLKKIEAAYRDSEERLRLLGDNLPDSYVFQFTRDPGNTPRFLYLSVGVERIHGVSRHAVLQNADALYCRIDSVQLADLKVREEESRRLMIDFQMDLRMCRDDGHWRWLRVHSRPRLNMDGSVIWDGFAMDITARKETDERLRYHELLTRAMGRMAKVGGWEFDPVTGKGTWTDEVARIHGLDPGDDTTVELGLQFYRGESRDLIKTAIDEAVTQKKPYDLVLELVTADGSCKWVQTIGYPVVENDRVVKVLGSFQDITERKRAEEEIRSLNADLEKRVLKRTKQLEALNKELESFTYSVSHDLKAPLRGIDGYSRLLEETFGHVLNDEGRLFVRNIIEGVSRVRRLIDDLLSYSRMERRSLNCSSINLKSLVDEMLSGMALDLESTGVEVDSDVAGVSVNADREGLSLVLRNLLGNAIKFSRNEQQARVAISAKLESGRAFISVRDNGIGFDMKYHDRIFEIYQRLEREEDYPGTGVGLALVRKAMQRMEGRVWAESVPGEGATFWLEFPA